MKPILLILVLVAAAPNATFASAVSVDQLLGNPAGFADREVTVTGELIGDYGDRGDEIWVQLNDDPYVQIPLLERSGPAGTNSGVGVRIPAALFHDRWGDPGGYRTRGPIVTVTGTFRYNEPAADGDTFIEAFDVVLVEAARSLPDEPVTGAWVVGVALVGLGMGFAGLTQYLRRRPPR